MNEVLRQERKFLIVLPDYYYHSGNLAKFMLEDPHNRGDGYPIRSLYFDSLEDRDFRRRWTGWRFGGRSGSAAMALTAILLCWR